MAYPTNPIYKLYKNIDGVVSSILTERNGLVIAIPISEDNKDYRTYLDWVAEGGVAEESD